MYIAHSVLQRIKQTAAERKDEMELKYRVGLPGWKWLARVGVPLSVRVDVQRDDEANVYVATSPDLAGLVVESASLDGLVPEVNDCVQMLLEEALDGADDRRHARADVHLGLLAHVA